MSIRTHWSSRTAFVLASVGSAIGLGNLIRFPYICSRYGGGAFLVAYFVALLTAGLPILILEFGLGHGSGGSAPKAFRNIHPKLEWLGWIAAGVGFFIVIYYSVIMAWGFSYLWDSFTLPRWAANAGEHFNKTLGVDKADGPFVWTGLQWPLFVGLVLTWIAVVAAVWKGATTVSKVVYATVLAPWAILLLFLIRAVTLPGAGVGLRAYLSPEWASLLKAEVWLAAYTQVFFSLSIGFGIMIAYASFLPKKSDLVKNAVIICIADVGTAFVSGFVVFGSLGYLSHQSGTPIAELTGTAGLGLAFVTYPTLISMLPFGSVFFAVLFYLMLLTLGIDSAFSLMEAFAASVRDKWNLSHAKANIAVGAAGLLIGIPLVSGAGLYWVDTMDHFLTYLGLGAVALMQCLVVSDVFACEKLRGHINGVSDIKISPLWDVMVMAIAPAALIFFIAAELWDRVQAPYGGYPRRLEFLGGWLVLILVLVMARVFHALPWAEPKEAEEMQETFDES